MAASATPSASTTMPDQVKVLSSLTGLDAFVNINPTDKSVGYCRSSFRTD
jgi:hypothetical protein